MSSSVSPLDSPLDLAVLERAEPGWERLRLANASGPTWDWLSDHPDRIRFATFRTPDGSLAGNVWFGPGCQGPPGHAHGGAIASLLDLLMGGTAWANGLPVVAAHLDIRYGRSVPLGQIIRFAARIERREKRVVHTTGELMDDTGKVFASGGGRFVIVRKARMAAFREEGAALEHSDGIVWVGNPGLDGEFNDGY